MSIRDNPFWRNKILNMKRLEKSSFFLLPKYIQGKIWYNTIVGNIY
jgi:hypothetical protein